jgi:TonB family protein
MPSASRSSLLTLLAAASLALGQTAATPSPAASAAQTTPAQASDTVEMPTDPATLLALAAKKNGLQNLTSTPWHLKASYEVLDEKGGIEDQGTYEEYWISAGKYRVSYSGPKFNQVFIANEKDLYRQGDAGTPRGPGSIVGSTLRGFSPPSDENKLNLSLDERNLGGVKLKCITLGAKGPGQVPPVDCLDYDRPILRLRATANGYLQTLFNNIAVFDGAYVARNIEVRSGTRTILHVLINALETFEPTNDTLFIPGADASPSPPRITTVGDNGGHVVKKVPPSYPLYAKQQHIQGAVVLHAVITPEGKVSYVEPISGPAELLSPAVDAVKQWQYQPYFVNGVPAEAEMEVNVVFVVGGR